MSTLTLTCALRLEHFVRCDFKLADDASWQTLDKLWRAALLAREAELEIPVLREIVARPIERPAYVSTPQNLASFALWLRTNQPLIERYYEQLARASRHEGDFDEGGITISGFASVQFDLERARHAMEQVQS